LLAFSRNRSTELTDVNVSALAVRVAARLQPQAKRANVRLHVESPTRNVRAVTNELELEQVVTNMLENTFAFSGADGETMIRCAQAEKEAVIIIEDDGPGIPEENLSQIFRPFFTTRGESGGTGLGLSLADKLIRGHHGTIFGTNRSEGGARFEIRLPRPNIDG
jgi:two-component system C4-dicarboxylate transport sensor histidine kinase DctB